MPTTTNKSTKTTKKTSEKAPAKRATTKTATAKITQAEVMAEIAPPKTKLALKYEHETEVAYEKIREALDNAAKSLALALQDFKDKNQKDLSQEDKQRYHRELVKNAKTAVKQIEKTNRFHIFAFRSATGSWWKIGGNSIAIHRLMISTYLDREVNVNVDRDNYAVFSDGVICLQDEYRLEKDIAYSGAQLTLDTDIDYGPFKGLIKAYRLRVPMADREIKRFRHIDEELMKNINNNIFSIAPDVEINNHITLALRESYQLERQLDGNAQAFVGHRLIASLFDMRRAYYDVANSSRKAPARFEAMERVDRCVGDAMSVLANYADLNIANRTKIAKVSLELAKVRELCRQKINQFNKRHEVVDKLEELQDS